MERFTGMAATILIVAITFPFALLKFDLINSQVLTYLPPLIIIAILFGIYIFLWGVPKCDSWQPRNFIFSMVLAKIREVYVLLQDFRYQRQLLFNTFLISIIFNLLAILNAYVVARALAFEVTLIEMSVLVPLILVISSIPLSINAIGIAEGAFVLCLSQVGLSPSEALSVALVIRVKNLFVSIIGGILFAVHSKDHRAKISIAQKNTA
jgi:uncharacterized membrane protein YbhN (UPF0104 family)